MTTRLRGIAAATLIASTSMAGLAQTKPATPATSASTAIPATPAIPAAAARSSSGYQSAFDGYRVFNEQKVLSWRESNDLVGRIGGWQAYAREAAGAEAMPVGQDPAPVKASSAAKSASAPSSSPNTSHGGHVMPQKP
ncbi:MAG: hypothetical protein H7Y33_14385 [Cytophagales bacterium]|nr:hypothetical protein [Rhizobacter sp.]